MGACKPQVTRRILLAGMATLAVTSASAGADRMRVPGREVVAPLLELPMLNGDIATLSAFPGLPVIVAFWATWCVPCRAELPALARLKEQTGVGVLAVNSGETESRVRKFLEAHQLHALPVLMDTDRRATAGWRVAALPTAYVVGPDRLIRYFIVGEIDWDDPVIRDRIQALRPPIEPG